MNIRVSAQGGSRVAIIESEELLIRSVQDALDLMSTVSYQHECHKMVVPKEAIKPEFFDLKTRLAGEILQKYTNYQMRLAIVGAFDTSRSKSLHDFIYESNNGSQVFFLPDEETAVSRLHELS